MCCRELGRIVLDEAFHDQHERSLAFDQVEAFDVEELVTICRTEGIPGVSHTVLLDGNDIAVLVQQRFAVFVYLYDRQGIFVTRNQHAILGGNQVRFNEICTLLDRQLIGCQRVFWTFAACAPVPDDERFLSVQGVEVDDIRCRNGGFQQFAFSAEMQQIGPKLLAYPDGAIVSNGERFWVEV